MVNAVKWYSAALRAAERLPQNFGTAQQLQAMLAKYGAKQSELSHLKVPDFLQQFGGGRVSKSALYDYIDKNKVLPTEVQKTGAGMSLANINQFTNTNDWASAGVRRFLAEAAAQDAPQVAWTTGAQQSARYQGHAPEGMAGFYDKMVPNILNKYLKPYGGQVTLAPLPNPHALTNDAAGFIVKDQGQSHTATLPEPLRKQLRENGIPFFRHGGTVEKYATVI